MKKIIRNWVTSQIGDLCDLKNGRAFKPTEWSQSGLPIVRIQNLNNPQAPFNRYSGHFDQKHHLSGGELLFAWSGTPGTSFGAHVWKGKEAVLNQHIFRVDFDESILDRRFFRHAINQKLNELIDVAHGGAGLQHVTKGVFESTEIQIPPRQEQTRIADKLDAVLSRVDDVNARLDRVAPLLKRFRQSVLAAATSGRLTEDWRDINDIDAAPQGMPASWVPATVRAVTADLRYGTSKKCSHTLDGIGVLRIPNISDGGRINIQDLKRADFEESEIAKLALKVGDLLIIRSNGSVDLVGKTSIVSAIEEGLLFAGYLMRLRVTLETMTPAYLYLCLSAPKQRQRIELTSKSTSGVNNINAQELQDLPISIPPLDEQTEIVRRVDILFAFAGRLEARLKAARTAAQRLTPAVLAKAFRGELVAQDPADEPAAELLQRLAAQRAQAPVGAQRSRSGARS